MTVKEDDDDDDGDDDDDATSGQRSPLVARAAGLHSRAWEHCELTQARWSPCVKNNPFRNCGHFGKKKILIQSKVLELNGEQ